MEFIADHMAVSPLIKTSGDDKENEKDNRTSGNKMPEDNIVKNSDDDVTVTSEEFDPSRGYRPRWRGTEEYIEDITYRIWEMRNVELIRDTYSESCPVFTLSGISLLLGLDHDLYQYSTVLQAN